MIGVEVPTGMLAGVVEATSGAVDGGELVGPEPVPCGAGACAKAFALGMIKIVQIAAGTARVGHFIDSAPVFGRGERGTAIGQRWCLGTRPITGPS